MEGAIVMSLGLAWPAGIMLEVAAGENLVGVAATVLAVYAMREEPLKAYLAGSAVFGVSIISQLESLYGEIKPLIQEAQDVKAEYEKYEPKVKAAYDKVKPWLEKYKDNPNERIGYMALLGGYVASKKPVAAFWAGFSSSVPDTIKKIGSD